MVLELRAPQGHDLAALEPVLPHFLVYVLSFINLGIYWNNHHHLFHACQRVNGAILWANMHLLFWLSLIPFTTGWVAESHAASLPTALYAGVLFLSAAAFQLMLAVILRSEGPDSLLARAIGRDWKGKISQGLYGVAVVSAFWQPWISCALIIVVALMWLVPDSRIERRLES